MPTVASDFPGAASPVGSTVRFDFQGSEREGVVRALLLRYASVVDSVDGAHFRVPYGILRVVRAKTEGIALPVAERMARDLMQRHLGRGGPALDWDFGFDLAASRAGACCFRNREITLSVGYCLASTKDQVRDTILHEIAHVIAGPEAGHGPKWRDAAKRIGCRATRCHSNRYTGARWIGKCGCEGKTHRRQRLSRRIRAHGFCKRCAERVRWRPAKGDELFG